MITAFRIWIFTFAVLLSLNVQSQQKTNDDASIYREATELAQKYYAAGKLDSAIIFANIVVIYTQKIYGKNSTIYAANINSLAYMYTEVKKYPLAEPLYKEAIALRKKLLGENNQDYSISVYNLALMYHTWGKLNEAEPLYKKATDFFKKNIATDPSTYLISLTSLGNLYIELGKYDNAIAVFNECIELRKKMKLPNDDDYISIITSLASAYNETGSFTKAKTYYEDALALIKADKGEFNRHYILVLNSLALLLVDIEEFTKAELLYKKGITILKKISSENDDDYITLLGNMGLLYMHMNKYKEAEIIFQNTLSIIKRKFKEKTLAYATAMNNLANVYNEMGNYTKAEENYLEVLEIREKFLGKNHLDYAFTLNALGLFYASTNRYTLSKELLLNALSVREKKLGKTSGAYAVTLNNLGLLYSNMGNYEAAELNYTEAFTIIKKVFGTNHNLYITALNNLGFLYKDIGKFEASEKYLLEALSILKNKSGEESNDYGLCQNNLGLLYLQTGNYTKAEKLFINASEIFKKNYGEQNVKYALMLNNLSVFYLKMGNFSKAETTLLAAINIYENNDIESSLSDYALAANNLGFVWEQYELFTEAEKMYTSAAKIYKAVAGAENPFYATCISNLARFYASRKQKQKAEELFKEVLNIRKKTLPLNHPDYALALNNLGAVYLDNGKTDSAEWVIQEAANIFKTNFGITHPEYTTSLYNLCYLYYINNRFANWQNIIDSIADVESKTKKTLLNSFTENEKEIYLTQKNYFHSVFQSMLFHFKSDKTKNLYQNIAANQEWLLKGKQLLNNLAATSNNQDVIALFNDWQKASVMYAKAIQLSQDVKEKNGLNEDSLLQKTELLEKKLIEALPSVQQTLKNNNIYFSAITKKLNTDDVVIHWTFYNYCNKNLWTDSIIYAAYISKSTDTAPKLITVFEEKQLQALLKKYHGGTGRSSIKRDATTSETVDQDLYNLIWKPLLPYIKDAKKIYNLPSGLLHKVSFNALSDSNNHQLMDYQEIHQLLSIDELLNPIPVTQKNKTIALFGGANYETSNATTTTEGSGTPVFRGTEKLPPSNTSFNYLAGTEKEVIAVANSADKVFWKVHSFTGTNANEENLKKLNGHNAPQILHIATHGFYFPHKSNPAELVNYKTTNDIEAKDFPLLRSGIVLSGANNYWNKDTLLYNKEDGIVTAQEISNINFFNTDLVVLSACETALGDITGTEGVYGLQRAFKMAGVKKILMSLWEVPDEETSELMQLFYTNIFNGDSYYIAFQKAQLRLKAKYKNPSKWAGFVLVGE